MQATMEQIPFHPSPAAIHAWCLHNESHTYDARPCLRTGVRAAAHVAEMSDMAARVSELEAALTASAHALQAAQGRAAAAEAAAAAAGGRVSAHAGLSSAHVGRQSAFFVPLLLWASFVHLSI